MRITVIVNDKLISINGETHICDFPVPEGMRAIQFYGDHGEAEWLNANNTPVDLEFMKPYIECWEAAKERDDILAAEEAKRQEDLANRYDIQRRQAYPSFGDQLDALYKAGLFPPELAAQIQAVKDQYPKPEGSV